MTPQEKAKYLVHNFLTDSHGTIEEYIPVPYVFAKQCALIAVDEILNNFGTLTEGKQHYAAYSTIKFYEEVKQEIINL